MPNYTKYEKFLDELFSISRYQEGREKIYKYIYILPFEVESQDLINLLKELLKYNDGVEAVKANWRILLNNSKEPRRILEIYKNEPEIATEVINDIPYLIKYSNIDDGGDIAKEIESFKGGKKAIADNFDELLVNANKNLDSIFCSALETEDGLKKAKEKFNILLKKSDSNEFFKFIEKIEDKPEFKEEAEKYSFWKDLYYMVSVEKNEIKESETYDSYYRMKNDLQDIINFQFKTIINSQDIEEKRMILETVSNGKKFEYFSAGCSSLVLKVGEQVVKFGIEGAKFEVPYHPRIMMPWFRKRYSNFSVLEVYNLGNTESAKITDEELLKIYKELENDGILWGDARKVNLVVLKQDNNLPDFIRSKDFNLFGFLKHSEFPTTNHIASKKGDIVICDLDFLYVKGDPEYRIGKPDEIIQKYLKDKESKEHKQEER